MGNVIMLMKALSDHNRLRVLCALRSHDELCACQLTELLEISGPTVSRHMGVLIAADLVSGRKKGRWVYYRLCSDNQRQNNLLSWVWDTLSDDEQVAMDIERLKNITVKVVDGLCSPSR